MFTLHPVLLFAVFIMVFGNRITKELRVNHLVLIPNTRCNMNCAHCFVPGRDATSKMSVELSQKIAQEIADSELNERLVVMWHGSEPLTTGLSHFKDLYQPWKGLAEQGIIVPYIHTHATLINDAWAEFLKDNNIRIGTSIDGTRELNQQRVFWNGAQTFDATMKGIETLKRHGIEFSVIAVVTSENLINYEPEQLAKKLYHFFSTLGCKLLGINIEEKENLNISRPQIDGPEVLRFWSALYKEWQANPVVTIRDIAQMLVYLEDVLEQKAPDKYSHDLIPTIGADGTVCLLSPEFLNLDAPEHGNFVVGNAKVEALGDIIARGIEAPYVQQFLSGVNTCRETCGYFEVCFGGHAVNKYSETKLLNVTETAHCRNKMQRLADSLLQ